MAENKLRANETREKTERKKSWAPAALLPDPNPEDGYTFHWVRISTRGEADPTNVSSKLREGWVPVKAVDHPEIQLVSIESDRFKDNIVMGGLMLCKAPKELVNERNAHFQNQAASQIRSVDNNLMRESDPRMPLFNTRKSEVTFGSGN